MSQIDAILTGSDAPTVAGAFVWAYGQMTANAPPRRESWVYPLALAALETAHFSAMYNWNPGNITSGTCGGKVTGTAGWYANPHVTVPLHFAAFRTIGEGCLGEMQTLSCMGAQAAADRGDYAGFMKALETGCYAGCQPYPDLSGYVAQYQTLAPTPYHPLTNAKALAIGTGLVALAAGAAWLIGKEPSASPVRHALARSNPSSAPDAMRVQSLLFRRSDGWTPMRAKKWARDHGYRSGDVDVTEKFIHLRQESPAGMHVVRTKDFGGGISARVGRA